MVLCAVVCCACNKLNSSTADFFLLFFLVYHLLILLLNPLQVIWNNGPNIPQIIIVNLSIHTIKLFCPFLLSPELFGVVIFSTNSLIQWILYMLIASCLGITPLSTHFVNMACKGSWSWVWNCDNECRGQCGLLGQFMGGGVKCGVNTDG